MSKERDYFRALRRAAAAVNSENPLKEKLDAIVRNTARAARSGVSLILLDATGTKLVPIAHANLPYFFIQKGLIDPDKSLSEVLTGKTVVIPDVAKYELLQYPDAVKKARIISILGVPLLRNGKATGAIRLYSREPRQFSVHDINLVIAMADLVGIALNTDSLLREKDARLSDKIPLANTSLVLKDAHPPAFGHPSESEFAGLLDFYNIPWIYEPKSFPLKWDGDRVTEMFTPDFYLPGMDLYIELTTMKQSLATIKNRKLRKIRELYPGTRIMLLRKAEYEKLLTRFGAGPLSQLRAHGIKRILYTEAEIRIKVSELARKISTDYAVKRPLLIGAQRGFLCFMADLMRQVTVPLDFDFISISHFGDSANRQVEINKEMVLPAAGRHIIMVEDIVDTGITLAYILNYLKQKQPASLATCVLLNRPVRRIADITLDYVGFEIPDEFVVGYGLDFKEEYRNLPFIGIPILENSAIKKGADGK